MSLGRSVGMGLHSSILQAFTVIFDTAHVAVWINGYWGEPFSVSEIRQGCPLNSTLFGMLADGSSLAGSGSSC